MGSKCTVITRQPPRMADEAQHEQEAADRSFVLSSVSAPTLDLQVRISATRCSLPSSSVGSVVLPPTFNLGCAHRGHADGGDGLAGLGVPQLGTTGGVADEDDFIDPSHPSILARLCKEYV